MSDSVTHSHPIPTAALRVQHALALAFAMGLWLPLLGLVLDWNPDVGLRENRPEAARPELPRSAAAWLALPRRSEAWFGDHFGFRDALIRANNSLRVLWFGVSPQLQRARSEHPLRPALPDPNPLARRITLGRDGWFYLLEGDMVDDLRGLRPASPAELRDWTERMEARRDALAELGVQYLFVLVPEKQSVYPEHLPADIVRVGDRTRADQLVDHLRAHSDLDVLDLRPVLVEARLEDRVFHRTGGHWNDAGALAATRAIASHLQARFPSLAPPAVEDFAREVEVTRARPLMRLVALRDVLQEETIRLVPRQPRRAYEVDDGRGRARGPGRLARPLGTRETGRTDLPRAIVLHDSFARVSLQHFLSEGFARTSYASTRQLDLAWVEREAPDVVIEERVERFLFAD